MSEKKAAALKKARKNEKDEVKERVLTDDEAIVLANQVRAKELTEINGGKLPELTDAGAEILQAQESAGTTDQTEPRVKPAMLTDEAEKVRRGFLENAFAKFNEERLEQNPTAFNVARKQLNRVKLVAVYQVIEVMFAGRPENSVSAEELRTHIENTLSALPKEAEFQFASDANYFISSRDAQTAKELRRFFCGRYNVSLNDVLLQEAQIRLTHDRREELKIDLNAVVSCEASPCRHPLFVPFSWKEYIPELGRKDYTGHVQVAKEDGSIKFYCPSHRGEGRRYSTFNRLREPILFYPIEIAKKIAASRERKHQERTEFLDSLKHDAGIKDERRPQNSPAVSEKRKSQASSNIFDLLDNVPGDYLIKHPTWEVRADDKVIQIGTEIFFVNDRWNNTEIVDAGKGFGKTIGQRFRFGDRSHPMPANIFRFLKEVQKLQEGS